MFHFCQAVALVISFLMILPSGEIWGAASRKEASKKIKSLLTDPQFKEMKIGIKIYSLKTDDVIFEHNPDLLLKPASNVKLVTTLAALKYLGSGYKFKTKIYTDGKVVKNVLHGNLYVKGFGDPKLVSEKLWFLTNELKRAGFRHVAKDLILDDSFFDEVRTVRNGRASDRAYDALLGALSVNFNTTAVYVKPGSFVGAKARVIIDPDNSYIRLVNHSKTVAAHKKKTMKVSRIPGKYFDTIMVRGGVPLGAPEKRFYKNVSHPRQYASSLFRRFFKEQGITIQGQNRYKVVPTTAKEILTYESRPLNMIITDLNRISNNFVAEQILKTMAAELKSIPGTTDNGLKILTEFLKEAGVSGNYQLVNGSGLSPDNLMTAAQFIEVLKFGYRHFEFFPEYISSMGIVGVDGTVNMRLRGTIAAGRVRAKTGSLTGVSALSGYLNTLSNETVAFSMIMNDPFDRDQLMQRFQDEILLNLCELK